MDVDGLTAVEPERTSPLLLALAVILPVGLFAAGAAWFIHTYVVPPTVDIPSQPVLASVEPTNPPATTGASTRLTPSEPPQPVPAEPQTPASAFPPPPQPAASVWPAPAPANNSPWPAVANVAPEPAAPAFAPAPEPIAAAEPPPDAGLPAADAVPLPLRRPRISLAVVRGPVPLPRPRPGN